MEESHTSTKEHPPSLTSMKAGAVTPAGDPGRAIRALGPPLFAFLDKTWPPVSSDEGCLRKSQLALQNQTSVLATFINKGLCSRKAFGKIKFHLAIAVNQSRSVSCVIRSSTWAFKTAQPFQWVSLPLECHGLFFTKMSLFDSTKLSLRA